MPARFALRIESGEQAGETHVLGDAGLTVGRRPGNDLVIRDASVSGRHARFSLEDGRVVMTDLASTNGCFVDDKRVEQATLDAGAFLRVGSVELELVAAEGAGAVVPASTPVSTPAEPDEIQLEGFDDAPVASVPAAAPPVRAAAAPVAAPSGELEIEGLDEPVFDDDNDGMHQIDAAALSKAKKGPGLVPLLLGVVVVGGAAGWYFMGMPGLASGDPTGGPVARAVVNVAGNLLADASFESGAGAVVLSSEEEDQITGAWTVEETAAVVPFASEAWRYGGELGLGADLEAGEAARVRSGAVAVGRLRGLEASGFATAEGAGVARLGIELFDAAGEHPVLTAWSAAGRDLVGEALSVSALAPAGYDHARVVLDMAAGTGGGAVGFDDVGLVAGGSGEAVSDGDFSLAPMGTERLALSYIDRPLIVDMTGSAPASAEGALSFAGAAGRFVATIDPGLLAEGLATLGAGGYRPHADAFEDAGVSSVVIGSGVHQVRLKFASAVTLTGKPLGVGYRLEAEIAAGPIDIELGFTEERARAARLDSKAREAETKERRGEALAKWQELLDEVPFDGELVLAAEAGRARLIGDGLAEVEALRGDFERAAFFGLPDLYRSCLDGVKAIQAEFAGNEVSAAADSLGQEVAAALAAVGGRDAARQRLATAQEAVLGLAEQEGFGDLAGHIKASLEGADKEAN